MFYPYDPKRLTMKDKEDAELLANDLGYTGEGRLYFIAGFFCGIQNRDKSYQDLKNEKNEATRRESGI